MNDHDKKFERLDKKFESVDKNFEKLDQSVKEIKDILLRQNLALVERMSYVEGFTQSPRFKASSEKSEKIVSE
jgi:hypothetical protein